MDRRRFLLAFGGGVLWGRFAEAQQPGRVYRLGILQPTAARASSDPTAVANRIVTSLRELGYLEGQNLVVEQRYAEGRIDRLPALARELVQLRVEVLVAVGSAAIRAAQEATPTLPIVLSAISTRSRPGSWRVSPAPEGTSPE
jgi:putative ABC transport system substrate-binding protein